MSLRVVIATDGSDEAVDGAARSLRLIPADADVSLVSVIEDRYDPSEDEGGFEGPIMTEAEADREFADNRAAGRAAIERTERRLGERSVEERLLPSTESVVQALCRFADDEDVDLLVVGHSHAGWLERILHGPTDEQLVRHAPCPVLVMNDLRS